MVRVLVLVDEHIPEFVLVIGQHIGVLLEEPDAVIEQVVKVHGPGVPETLRVGGAELRRALTADVAAALLHGHGGLRVDQGILVPLRCGKEAVGRESLFVDVQVLQHPLHHRKAVRPVVDGKAFGESQPIRVAAQDAHAGPVECEGPHIPGFLSQPDLQAVFQLVRRLVGKGDGQDLPGRWRVHGAQPADLVRYGCAPVVDRAQLVQRVFSDPAGDLVTVGAPAVPQKVGNAVDKHRGLAAASSRQKQQRPFRGENGLALHIIQSGKLRSDYPSSLLGIFCLCSFHLSGPLKNTVSSRL